MTGATFQSGRHVISAVCNRVQHELALLIFPTSCLFVVLCHISTKAI